MNKRINNAKKGVKPNKAKALSCLMALLLLLSLYGCSKQETGSAVTSSNVIAEVDIPEEDGLADGEALNREDVESIGETTSEEGLIERAQSYGEDLSIQSGTQGQDNGPTDEELQAEIDEAPVSDTSEGRGLEDLDEETLEMTNNLTFNGVQYDTIEEWQKAVNEYDKQQNPEDYMSLEDLENFFVDPSELPKQ